MLPDMSGDRLMAYRVFQGEIEKLRTMKKFPPDNTKADHLSGTEALVLEYFEKRCKEMIEKGHFWYDNASD